MSDSRSFAEYLDSLMLLWTHRVARSTEGGSGRDEMKEGVW